MQCCELFGYFVFDCEWYGVEKCVVEYDGVVQVCYVCCDFVGYDVEVVYVVYVCLFLVWCECVCQCVVGFVDEVDL